MAESNSISIPKKSESKRSLHGKKHKLSQVQEQLKVLSGGDFAKSAALALYETSSLGARDIVEKSLNIAASLPISQKKRGFL